MIKKEMLLVALLVTLSSVCLSAQDNNDWANFAMFAQENASLKETPVAVFMGNSITQNWRRFHPDYFASHNYAGRGISGQTSPKMLSRFRPDVLNLHPKVVVIFCGTNDIAQNNGYISNEHVVDNIISMVELAQLHQIKVILCSVLPAGAFGWRTEEFNKAKQPAKEIIDLNKRIKAYAQEQNIEYVDFWTPMANEDGSMKAELTNDGVHPLPEAYFAMEALITPVIERLARTM